MSYGTVMSGAYCQMPMDAYCHLPASGKSSHVATGVQPSHGLWIAFAVALLVLTVVLVKGALGWWDRHRARHRWS